MKKRLITLAVLSQITWLSGCSNNPVYGEKGLLRDRNQEYERATASQRLQLPDTMARKQTDDLLVIPPIDQTATQRQSAFVVPRPEFFYADTGSDAVSLKKLGDQKVIVVDEPIADVWQKTLDFMAFNNIPIASRNAQKARIESDWILVDGPEQSFLDRWLKRLTFQDIPGGTRNKLKIQLKPDPQDFQRTAIEMHHVQYPKNQQVSEIDWQKDANAVGYQADMMYEMLRYLSKATADSGQQSLLGYQQKKGARPLLGRDSRGNPVLKLETSADQAWQLVNQAVDQAGLDVGTRRQSTGMLYLTYTTTTPSEDKKSRGFFAWLFGERDPIKLDSSTIAAVFGSDQPEQAIRYSRKNMPESGTTEAEAPLDDPTNKANQQGYKIWFAGRVIYVFGGGGDGQHYDADSNSYQHTGRYQIQLRRSRSGVYVNVLNDEGIAAPAMIADEILWAIKDNMPSG